LAEFALGWVSFELGWLLAEFALGWVSFELGWIFAGLALVFGLGSICLNC